MPEKFLSGRGAPLGSRTAFLFPVGQEQRLRPGISACGTIPEANGSSVYASDQNHAGKWQQNSQAKATRGHKPVPGNTLNESNGMTEDIITAHPAKPSGSRVRLAAYLPLLVFIVMAVFLGIGLTLNPREIPSPLIGKPVPEFTLPPVKGRTLGLASADLRGQVSLVNVFASWCVACREEHPLWMSLSQEGIVPIHGLNYKDQPNDAQAWLDELGDPYERTGADISGRVGIDWGVYGVPETFVIDREGHIAYKHIGAITRESLRDTIMPLVRRLQQPRS